MKVFELFDEEPIKFPDLPPPSKLKDVIRESCAKNLALMASGKVPLLYRGMRQVKVTSDATYSWAIMRERDEPRRSATDNSLFLSYTGAAPEWAKVPNRLYSTSCTPDFDSAESFGTTFMVIPFDSVTEAAWIPQDFNYHEVEDVGNLIDLLAYIENVFDALCRLSGSAPPALEKLLDNPLFNKKGLIAIRSLEEIRFLSDTIHAARKIFSKRIDEELFDGIEALYEAMDGKSLFNYFRTQLTPAKMGVHVSPLSALKPQGRDAEVWFNGPYLVIRTDHGDADYNLKRLKKLIKA